MTANGQPEVVEGTGTEIAVPDHDAAVSLFGTSDPVTVLSKATAVADALADVIQKRGLFANISGKSHVLVEGWQLLGSMLGVFPVESWTRPVDEPEGQQASGKGPWGHEARYEARTRDGAIVGAGVARCTRSEGRWRGAEDHAVLSMAQTRATSKALKGPLGFIVNLAGYATTPAEEVASAERAEPQRATAAKVTATAPPAEKAASAQQRGKINAAAGRVGLSAADLANLILKEAGEEAREYSSDEHAARTLSKLMDRLPQRLVSPVLQAIGAVADEVAS